MWIGFCRAWWFLVENQARRIYYGPQSFSPCGLSRPVDQEPGESEQGKTSRGRIVSSPCATRNEPLLLLPYQSDCSWNLAQQSMHPHPLQHWAIGCTFWWKINVKWRSLHRVFSSRTRTVLNVGTYLIKWSLWMLSLNVAQFCCRTSRLLLDMVPSTAINPPPHLVPIENSRCVARGPEQQCVYGRRQPQRTKHQNSGRNPTNEQRSPGNCPSTLVIEQQQRADAKDSSEILPFKRWSVNKCRVKLNCEWSMF